MTRKPIRKPNWIKAKLPGGANYSEIKGLVAEGSLHTVCQSARCPNLGECWEDRTATFMILGDVCTRHCGFCAVDSAAPAPVDHGEPELFKCVAALASELNARFPDQLGLVVGATRTDSVKTFDTVSSGLPWLVPGLGAQGGQAATFFAGVQQDRLMVVNVSRSILFAPEPRQEAERMKREIQEARNG